MVATGSPCSHYENYVVDVWPVGDSITNGVGAAVVPGWRKSVYFGAAGALRFVGSQSHAGVDNSLAADPWHDGHNGYCVSASVGNSLITGVIQGNTQIYNPDLVLLNGGINDIITLSADFATVVGSLSQALDLLWTLKTKAWMKIVVGALLKNLTPAVDAVVQQVNAAIPAMVAAKSYASSVTFLPQIYNSIQNQTIGGGYNDATHPNDTGYADMGAAFLGGLTTPLRRARPS